MNEKLSKATALRPLGDRKIDGPLVTLDFARTIEQIRTEKPWSDNNRNAITVFKTNGLSVLLIALHKGAELTKHTAAGMITVQVLEGQIHFTTDEQSVELTKGQMLVLHEGIFHSVQAKEETVFLLTVITKPFSAQQSIF